MVAFKTLRVQVNKKYAICFKHVIKQNAFKYNEDWEDGSVGCEVAQICAGASICSQ